MKKKTFVLGMLCLLILLLPPFTAASKADVIAAGTNDQATPAIAHNPSSDEYLIVWQEEQSTGNYDILAQRLSAAGALLDGPVSIAASSHTEAFPAVAYNAVDDEYLVVYAYAYSATDYDIHARRVSGAGDPLESEIWIARLTNYESRPAVAHNPDRNEYLIVWQHLSGSDEFTHNDIRGLRVNNTGAPLTGFLIIDDSLLDESEPDVAFGNIDDRYLVTWQEKQSGTGVYNIHGKMVSDTGAVLSPELTIASWEYDLIAPAIAYNGTNNEFLVVWEDHRWAWGEDWNVYGQRVTGAGSLTGVNFGIAWKITGRDQHRMRPEVAFKPAVNEYLVVWEYAYSADDHDIYARRLDADGTLLENEIPVVTSVANEGLPVVAADNGLNYFVAWETGASGAADIHGDVVPLYELSGIVLAGTPGNPRGPISDVWVELLCSDNSTDTGDFLGAAVTDEDGNFSLLAANGCSYYNIMESDPPEYVSTGAESPSGTVVSSNRIRHSYSLAFKDTTGNLFYDEEVQPPGEWTNFTPTTTVYQEPVACAVQVRDTVSGLDVSSAEYAVSTDAGASWGTWASAACTGSNGTTGAETLSAGSVSFGQDSGPDSLNRVRFRISDLAGNIGQSPVYLVDVDAAPPVITTGPTVVEITAGSARVRWGTDKPSDGFVQYGRQSGQFSDEVSSATLVTQHEVSLTGLDASATYHVQVRSTAANGQSAETGDIHFVTAALPDFEDPSVSLIEPAAYQGIVTLSANASDDNAVEKVEFFLDEQRIHTAFGPHFSVDVDTRLFSNGDHTLMAKATDLSGRTRIDEKSIQLANIIDAAAPNVTITAPATDYESVTGTVTVTAELSDDTGLAYVFFKVDGVGEAFRPLPDHPKQQTLDFEWDSTQTPNGSHTLAVEVYDSETPYARYAYAVRQVTVDQVPPALPPKLKTSHTIGLYGNIIAVSLVVTNVGEEPATNIEIQDFSKGFQPISDSYETPVKADFTAKYDSYKQEWECVITSREDIPANSSKTYTYFAVPVLLEKAALTPQAGFRTGVHYDEDSDGLRIHDWYEIPEPRMFGGQTIAEGYDEAVRAADYLIVTHPNRLFAFGPSQTDEVYGLLSDMAELARYRNGVLAFLDSYDRDVLKELIRPGLSFPFAPEAYLVEPGKWSKKLASDWTSNGYLLLVGENNIIPGWSRKLGSHSVSAGGTHTWIANPADYPYADNTGDELYPELSMGRIVGNQPSDLRVPIRTSINVAKGAVGYGFDRTHSLLVSGFSRTLGGGAMPILTEQEVDRVLDEILDRFFPPFISQTVWHTPVYTVYNGDGSVNAGATTAAIRSEFVQDLPGKDVIFLAGHGNPNTWDEIDANTILGQTNPFNGKNPFVFASSCSTGNYTNGTGMAEAFLSREAAAYLGAVIEGGCHSGGTCPNADTFFHKWDDDEPVGLALKQTKRGLYLNFVNRLWAGIYQLYGDPKFGALPSVTPPGTLTTSIPAPADAIEINVPDFEVTVVDGEDHVHIPGGGDLLVTGMPVVPYYRVIRDYPAGTQIRDVQLAERTEEILQTPLNLPIGLLGVLGCCEPPPEAQPTDIPAWWPDRHFDWEVIESPDKVSLAITVFPLVYSHETGQAVFSDYFRFDVTHEVSGVSVLALGADKPAYEPGETVLLEMMLKNTGPPMDVVVQAVVTEEDSEEAVSGLVLETLQSFEGSASLSRQWSTATFSPGYYRIRLTASDLQGTVLDRETRTFRIGTPSAGVADLSVTPEFFTIGDPVGITLALVNDGSMEISGTAVIEVRDSGGVMVHEETRELLITPSATPSQWDFEWDSTGAAAGAYEVLGYLRYDGMATDPVIRQISASNCLYDANHDGDVDGRDLFERIVDPEGPDPQGFSLEFGNMDCR